MMANHRPGTEPSPVDVHPYRGDGYIGNVAIDTENLEDIPERTHDIATVQYVQATEHMLSSSEADPTDSQIRLGSDSDRERTAELQTLLSTTATEPAISGWLFEARLLSVRLFPVLLSSIFQFSFNAVATIVVGHLGTTELAAVSLATATADFTGYVVYQGMASALDTLCTQAFGSGNREIAELQMYRMICFLGGITVPIAMLWINAEHILFRIIPDSDVTAAAGVYLRILLIGTPGYLTFECGKRLVLAKALFYPPFYSLLFCALLHALLSWLFVWHLHWGLIGAPIATALVHNLLPVSLYMYMRFINAEVRTTFYINNRSQKWRPMIGLALSGFVILEAQVLAFELLAILAGKLGTDQLAAQSIVATASLLAFQVPCSLAVAAGFRIAHFVGAASLDHAKFSARVAIVGAICIGCMNSLLMFGLQDQISWMFTRDQEIMALAAGPMTICASYQVLDSIGTICTGVLRGLGKQAIGGLAQFFSYYIIALPMSVCGIVIFHWGLDGLWLGLAIAVGLVAFIEAVYLVQISWDECVNESRQRNITT